MNGNILQPPDQPVVPAGDGHQASELERLAEAAVIEELKEEMAAEQVGGEGLNEDYVTLLRYLRLRNRIAGEIETIQQRVNLIVQSQSKRLAGLDGFYQPLVAEIVRKRLAGSKKKSIRTEFGTAGFRTTPAKLKVVDESLLPSDLKREIPAQYPPNMTKISDHFKTTGEVAPGCELQPAAEKFYVSDK